MAQDPAKKKYYRRFVPLMAIYVAAIFSASALHRHGDLHGPLMYLVAVAPAVPIIGIIVVVSMYMKELRDEFERAVRTQSMLWGIGLTLSFTTVWGFLEVYAGIPHLDGYLAFPIMCFCTGVAHCLIARSYR